MARSQLLTGHLVEVLKQFEDNSLDSCVTDPPYEIGFMTHAWDCSGVAFDVETWKAVYRVLKPGGYLLAFGGARTYHRMACAVEDAGFEIRDQIMWLYGQGMPKSLAVDKAIDKQGSNRDSDAFIPFSKHYAAQRVAAGYTHARVCELGHFYSNVNHGGLSVNWETGLSLPTAAQWDIVAPILKLDEKWRALVAREEQEREVVGTRKVHKGLAFTSEGKEFLDVTTPATPASAAWAGWGTALKPAHEPIVVARKPFPGTVASNVLKYGTGGINIDGCRVEHVTVEGGLSQNPHLRDTINGGNGGQIFPAETERRVVIPNQLGRWPANVIHDGSDEVREAFPDAQGQQGDLNETGKARPSQGRFGDMAAPVAHAARVEDDKNASRFFNTCRDGEASASKRYTAEGATSFSMLPGQRRFDSGSVARFFYCAKPTSKERHMGLEDPGPQFQHGDTLRKVENKVAGKGNSHPTVKPLALMRWLQRMVTPPGGTTFDPFLGSGTSAMSAAQENFDFIGIELDPQWLPVQIARTRAAAPDATIISETEVTQ